MPVISMTRRARAKTQEAASQAKAQSDMRKAVLKALEGYSGAELDRRLDALLDTSAAVHAAFRGAMATTCRMRANEGRLAPPVFNNREDKFARAEAMLKGRAA